MYQVRDAQTGEMLAGRLDTLAQATARMEELLGHIRGQVEATGDSVDGMWLEWVVTDPGGRVVAGHSGAPVPWPW